MSVSLRQRLESDLPLLADGAMGTLLHSQGVPIDGCFDHYNVTQPDLIKGLHRAYLDAGAELIETNTFGANRLKLQEHGLEDQVVAINAAGVALVREAIRESGRQNAYAAGSVGPLGTGILPYGRLKVEDAHAIFAEQIMALVAAGADAIICETFTHIDELVIALEAARQVAAGVPVICEMTFTRDDRTISGHLPGAVARRLADAGADVIGVNCSGGPAQIVRVVRQMKDAVPDGRFSAMPNAGFPQTVGGRMMYPATTEYFGENALLLRAIGVSVIGGCCGTTPDHIQSMRAALDDPAHPTPALPRLVIRSPEEEADSAAAEMPSELYHKLHNGKFLFSVEMAPPRSHNLERLIDAATLLRDAGADVLDVADSPTARMRLSPWAACSVLQTRLGMETVLHFPVRGRNLLRVQGDLLGAHALGVRNLFVVMGDPTRIGDYPEAMDNYDIAPSGLIRLVKQRMNAGVDQAGNSIGQPTSFTVGCALNMGADDPDKEIDVLRKKIEAGADFALGQPVFEPARVERFLKRYEEIVGEPMRLPVMLGMMPLYSLRHARFIDNEIPGISIPPEILKRMESAGESAAQEGVRIAQELLSTLKDYVRGAYIIPAFGRYDLAAQVIDSVAVRS
ncbi:MAG: bifunctional homocysteine S-methyltransferase/methylenetetrahydrofolate reductase [Anaerolineae bacterium]|nr:bifunctional homocysteine S-methyltransferase/methylenetetrahydrofolate reductase [Anaerolineae bacterium]